MTRAVARMIARFADFCAILITLRSLDTRAVVANVLTLVDPARKPFGALVAA